MLREILPWIIAGGLAVLLLLGVTVLVIMKGRAPKKRSAHCTSGSPAGLELPGVQPIKREK